MSCVLGIPAQCAQNSVGSFNSLVSTLLQALAHARCEISPDNLWPADYGPEFMKNPNEVYDFVVVGAGSAGSVIASRLSENPSVKVLVLESGTNPPAEEEVPMEYTYLTQTPYSWNYTSEFSNKSCLSYENHVCPWPRGRMIGGSSGINLLGYSRGREQDYDNWMSEGNRGWSWNDVYPYFKKSINQNGNKSEVGLILSSVVDGMPAIRDMLFSAAEETGYSRLRSAFDGLKVGYLPLPLTVADGRRYSVAKGYLVPVKDRPNLHIIKSATANRIVIDQLTKTVTGVEFVYEDRNNLTVKAGKEVIVCAGVLNSPKLLMLSGIGPAEHLIGLGITPVQNLPVGDNLQDHVSIPLYININTTQQPRATYTDQLNDIYEYLINSTGFFTTGGSYITLYIDTANTSSDPDMYVHQLFTRAEKPSLIGRNPTFQALDPKLGDQIGKVNEQYHILILQASIMRPKSRGRVRLSSSDPRDILKIFPNYFENPDDMETALRGIQTLLKYIKAKAFRDQGAELMHLDIEECDEFTHLSEEYWKCYIRHMSASVYHPAGTVKMGTNTNPSSVVDFNLRVKGIDRLRVIDSSIMPNVVSGNLNGPTVMIAEKGADLIQSK